ncbi:MAG: amidohydrolase family protein [Gammaproteobacteria bacterium]
MTTPTLDPAIRIIDVDTHLTEPHDLWTSRAPAQWKARVPQVKDIEGVPHWVFEGDQILGTTRASSVVRPDRSKGYGVRGMNFKFHEVHRASYDIGERLKFMDETGIWAQIVYPNLMGFSGLKAPGKDPKLKTLCVKIYNDAMAEFQEQSGQRIFGMALLPWWDIGEAVAEARRCKDMGIRGVNTNPNPQQQGFPELTDPQWAPLLDLCGEMDLPINFHIGASEDQLDWFGSVPWKSHPDDVKLAIGSATLHMQNASVVTNIIMSGLPERFPKTRFVSVESGVGWLPFLLEALDYYVSHEIPRDTARMYRMLPSEYFRRQFHACFWFEHKFIRDTIRALGEDNIMFESDFPHPTCLYPDAVGYVTRGLSDLEPGVLRKVLSTNAARLYSIPV